MRYLIKTVTILFSALLISCGGEEKKEEKIKIGQKPKVETKKELPVSDEVPASKRITLDNKGVGKIKNLELNPTIDQAMVERGAALFKTNCTACHKIGKRFIGPSPSGIMKRRSPEWIMNMILDPKLMAEEDQCAKDLLVEFNGAAMANQNLTEAQARDILEYFRTLN
ncbi:c-type cytochrome [Constantimarinum furrinae]|uniref:Cytochrome c n=1 Tax=Constantimarinum furrinae TaxID=2562285 RepID=A0A7G8PXL9_9FLAO|nr:cytochrome c [Constantimarinum furrinae]QNJ99085.1 Cytochrome c [Constantimarinum furrinae]